MIQYVRDDFLLKFFIAFSFYFKFATVYTLIVVIFSPGLRSIIENRRALAVDLKFKNFDEQENILAYLIHFTIQSLNIFGLTHTGILCATCFVLFSSYINSQLELIGHYIENLPLKNVKDLANHLSEITDLHLDVLR